MLWRQWSDSENGSGVFLRVMSRESNGQCNDSSARGTVVKDAASWVLRACDAYPLMQSCGSMDMAGTRILEGAHLHICCDAKKRLDDIADQGVPVRATPLYLGRVFLTLRMIGNATMMPLFLRKSTFCTHTTISPCIAPAGCARPESRARNSLSSCGANGRLIAPAHVPRVISVSKSHSHSCAPVVSVCSPTTRIGSVASTMQASLRMKSRSRWSTGSNNCIGYVECARRSSRS